MYGFVTGCSERPCSSFYVGQNIVIAASTAVAFTTTTVAVSPVAVAASTVAVPSSSLAAANTPFALAATDAMCLVWPVAPAVRGGRGLGRAN